MRILRRGYKTYIHRNPSLHSCCNRKEEHINRPSMPTRLGSQATTIIRCIELSQWCLSDDNARASHTAVPSSAVHHRQRQDASHMVHTRPVYEPRVEGRMLPPSCIITPCTHKRRGVHMPTAIPHPVHRPCLAARQACPKSNPTFTRSGTANRRIRGHIKKTRAMLGITHCRAPQLMQNQPSSYPYPDCDTASVCASSFPAYPPYVPMPLP